MSNIIETTWTPILLGSITVIVGIIVPTILYILSKREKKLIYELLPSLSLVDVRNEIRDKIKIYYNENLVENLSMMKVKIKNNGNVPIQKKDIIKPLEFNFGENLSVIDYNVADKPKGIDIHLEPNTENNLIICSFDLLNQRENFTLQFVCLGEIKEPPIISARIVGIKHAEIISISEITAKFWNFSILGGFLVLIYSSIIIYLYQTKTYFIVAVLAIIVIILGILAKKGYIPIELVEHVETLENLKKN